MYSSVHQHFGQVLFLALSLPRLLMNEGMFDEMWKKIGVKIEVRSKQW